MNESGGMLKSWTVCPIHGAYTYCYPHSACPLCLEDDLNRLDVED